MKIMLPVVGVLLAGLAALSLYLFKQGLDDYLANKSLAAVEIVAPAGVAVVDYDAAQGMALTGRAFNLDPEVTDQTNELLRRFEASAGGIDDGVAQVFVKGEQRVALSLHRAPYVAPPQTLASQLGLDEPNPEPEIESDVFGTVAGIEVILQPAPERAPDQEPVSYRHFVVNLGDPGGPETVEITVLTNASDAFVASVFDSLDIAALNERLPEPDVRIVPDGGFVPAADGPLSQTPPTPAPALLAYRALQSGVTLTALDRDVLERVRAGEISDMAGLQARFPDLVAPTVAMMAVLGQPTPEVSARFAAVRLLKGDRDWSQTEAFILAQVARPDTTQADLLDYLSLRDDIAPEVLALVSQLP